MMSGFSLEIETKQDIPVINIVGEIDVYTCPQLRSKLTELVETGNHSIILNLENIHYIDSTGLGTIAHTARSVETNKGKICIVCTKNQIKKIFEVSGLEKKNVFLCADESTAIKEIK